MSLFMEMFSYSFMQRALIAGLFVGISCPVIGVFLILRRMPFLGNTIGHVAFTGVAFGLLIGANPLGMALVAACLTGIGIERLGKMYATFAELSTALVLALALSLGIVFIGLGKGFGVNVMGYLFGSILTVSSVELWFIAGLALISLAFVLLFYLPLFAIAFHEESARVLGIRVDLLNLSLNVIVALVTAAALRIVGVFLVSALLILPAAAAIKVATSFRQALILSALFGLVSVFGGLVFSYVFNLAAGGAIGIVAGLVLIVALVFSANRKVGNS
ncbi:MAG: metal ABC transporter permease [Limnochordia bacterium]|nr:metal ABC transporter permease [Limnochordia bacterium]